MSAVPSGGNTWKTIIIGVLTTVVAYLIVHFIFDKKDARKEKREKKEKIETTWNSVNEYINRAKEKFNSISCFSCDEEQMKNELIRELDQMNKSLQNIKESSDLDEKMKTIIDRTIQMFADEKPVIQAYYDSLVTIDTLPAEKRTPITQRLQQKMISKMAHIQTRDSVEFSQYLGDLNKKYSLHLERKEPKLEVDLEALPGSWNVECSFTMNFKKDHSISLEKDKERYPGKWKLDGNNVTISFDDGSSTTYAILELNQKLMLMFNLDTEIFTGACRQ